MHQVQSTGKPTEVAGLPPESFPDLLGKGVLLLLAFGGVFEMGPRVYVASHTDAMYTVQMNSKKTGIFCGECDLFLANSVRSGNSANHVPNFKTAML